LAAEDSERMGSSIRSGRDFKVATGGKFIARTRIVTSLNVLGTVGYYFDGPRKGVAACIDGFDSNILAESALLEEKRKIANRRMVDEIRSRGLIQGEHVQWFHSKDNYSGMSGKVIGSFCSYLRFQRPVNPIKYLLGMMNVPPEIPGWGSLPAPFVKVSGRAPVRLASLVEKGERPPLSRIMAGACSEVGGFGDGHSVAASGVFPEGQEEAFVKALEHQIAN